MPYITREDGEHFVVPSYRDILSAKKPALLKKEILLLSSNYGNYITLQRKNADQYEAAFANEPGYLLGESVWLHFKRPTDLIYCEAIPGTTEALLVIVKSGSVYLDGSFPLDSIPDELVIFKTQPGNFQIYIHGDVPISEKHEEGKISLNAPSVKSFTILPDPVFPTLATPKEYHLTQAETVLKNQGIGVVPVKKIILILSLPTIAIIIFLYFSSHQGQAPRFITAAINPWQNYYDTLASTPAPSDEIHTLIHQIAVLYTAPGWVPDKISYSNGTLTALMISAAMKVAPLYAWSSQNNADFQITPDGILITMNIKTFPRPVMNTYFQMQEVVGSLIDRVGNIWVGMNVAIGDIANNGPYNTLPVAVSFTNTSLQTLDVLGTQLNNLPLVFSKAEMTVDKVSGTFSGKFTFQALGA